ncbi:keratin-associated protein 19-2-like [Mizuhopecten yessoensis]|uniref:Uncharacterized protein n=1 Tax=Mizuhopecten yessoensis TaxID=6573 RepID=A0A210QV65_MIZYE|nr:keratin-associated protein 19-2-like [Mizuhopecten yessoensis]OWF52621.1 hypothetical protein KP79_PYT04085 [Mizuhopecten yessoensis]
MRLLLIAIASGAVLVGLFSAVHCDGGYGGYNNYGNYGGYDNGYGYGDQGYGGMYVGSGYGGYGGQGGYGGNGYGGYGGKGGYGGNGGGGGGGYFDSRMALSVPYGISVPPIAPPVGFDQSGLYGGNNNSIWTVVGIGFLFWLLASGASSRTG